MLSPGSTATDDGSREDVPGHDLDLHQGQVEHGVPADDLRGNARGRVVAQAQVEAREALVRGIDLARDHVVVGQEVAAGIDEEAAADDPVGVPHPLFDLDAPVDPDGRRALQHGRERRACVGHGTGVEPARAHACGEIPGHRAVARGHRGRERARRDRRPTARPRRWRACAGSARPGGRPAPRPGARSRRGGSSRSTRRARSGRPAAAADLARRRASAHAAPSMARENASPRAARADAWRRSRLPSGTSAAFSRRR